jgi:Fe-S-cluster-containing hydrogenase component 2
MKRIKSNNDNCRDCQACQLACSLYHEEECNPSLSRVLITKNMEKYTFNITICEHCDSPECVDACPSEALIIDDRGVVLFVEENCTRCGSCAEACPYDAIYYNEAQDKYFKCDMCKGREEGPLCTELCPVEALVLVEEV